MRLEQAPRAWRRSRPSAPSCPRKRPTTSGRTSCRAPARSRNLLPKSSVAPRMWSACWTKQGRRGPSHRGDGSGGRRRRQSRGSGRGRGRGLRLPGKPGGGSGCFGPHGGRGRRHAGRSRRSRGGGLAVGLAGGAAYGLVKGTEWVLDNTIFRPQQGGGDEAVQDVRSANGMNDITQAQHFSLRSGSTPSHSRTSSVVSNSDPGFQAQSQSSSSQPSSRSASSFRVQAQSNHTPRPFAWGINPVMPQRKSPASSRASSSSRGSGLPPPSFEQLARDIEAA